MRELHKNSVTQFSRTVDFMDLANLALRGDGGDTAVLAPSVERRPQVGDSKFERSRARPGRKAANLPFVVRTRWLLTRGVLETLRLPRPDSIYEVGNRVFGFPGEPWTVESLAGASLRGRF